MNDVKCVKCGREKHGGFHRKSDLACAIMNGPYEMGWHPTNRFTPADSGDTIEWLDLIPDHTAKLESPAQTALNAVEQEHAQLRARIAELEWPSRSRRSKPLGRATNPTPNPIRVDGDLLPRRNSS